MIAARLLVAGVHVQLADVDFRQHRHWQLLFVHVLLDDGKRMGFEELQGVLQRIIH